MRIPLRTARGRTSQRRGGRPLAVVALLSSLLPGCAAKRPTLHYPGAGQGLERYSRELANICLYRQWPKRGAHVPWGYACQKFGHWHRLRSEGWFEFHRVACLDGNTLACSTLTQHAISGGFEDRATASWRHPPPRHLLLAVRATGDRACQRGEVYRGRYRSGFANGQLGDTCLYTGQLYNLVEPRNKLRAVALMRRGCRQYNALKACQALKELGHKVDFHALARRARKERAAYEAWQSRFIARQERAQAEKRAAAAWRWKMVDRNVRALNRTLRGGRVQLAVRPYARRRAGAGKVSASNRSGGPGASSPGRGTPARGTPGAKRIPRQRDERRKVGAANATKQPLQCRGGQQRSPSGDGCVPAKCPRGSYRAPDGSCARCQTTTSCLLVKQSRPKKLGYCAKSELTLMATINNTCTRGRITCMVCPENGEAKDCANWTLSPGQTLGGWASDLIWCNKGRGVRFFCVNADHGAGCLPRWKGK